MAGPPRPLTPALVRLHVLVQPEQVCRVIPALERDEPSVLLRRVGVAHAVLALALAQVVDVDAAREWPRRLPEVARPGDVPAGVHVRPAADDGEIKAGATMVEGRRLPVDAAHGPAELLDQHRR